MEKVMMNLYTKIYGEEKNINKIELFEKGFHCGVMYLYRMLYDGTITLKDIDFEKLNLK